MKTLSILLPALFAVLLSGCTTPQHPGGPGYAPPPTVLMPVDGSAREREFAPRIEDVLRRAGYETVYRGAGDLLLEFAIEEGPVNVDTRIRLLDKGRVTALGQARASGPPLINRNRVVEDSFFQALQAFESQVGRSWSYR